MKRLLFVLRPRLLFGALPVFFLVVFLVASLLSRCLLLSRSLADVNLAALPLAFGQGLMLDIIAGGWAMLPIVLLHLLLPRGWRTRPVVQWLLTGVLLISWYLLSFNALAELLFWNEFGVRFNFIAVDYLVYTHEVWGNIRESYPVPALLGGLLVPAVLGTWLMRGYLVRSLATAPSLRTRAMHVLAWGGLLAAGWLLGGLLSTPMVRNQYNRELAGNGLYSFFHAFRHNELEYNDFYATLPPVEVEKQLAQLVHPVAQDVREPRMVVPQGPERHLNVVLISVESLSADFMGTFGNTRGLTPHLDRLARDSLLFTRLYATGTRTVRGLEALTLSLPPTPGQSIVKRPDNANLFSLGSVFRSKGYDVRYVYGGYGYFDNMNAFFGANGYQIVDRTDIPQQRIPFENIWGVADEALFDQAIEELDRSYAAQRPSFTHIMTTSNHRPYTYPPGRIDIPSHTGRDGGVKYTDYAIGRFIEAARSKPWFKDTVFVIVADHCASSAGKTELPVRSYHIPLLIYAPAQWAPRRVERLTSQIDIAPTVLGLLNFAYDTRFLGHDVLTDTAAPERAFISTYQSLGYLKNGVLTVLRPRRQVEAFRVDADDNTVPTAVDPQLKREAIAYYQGASELYRSGWYKAPNAPR